MFKRIQFFALLSGAALFLTTAACMPAYAAGNRIAKAVNESELSRVPGTTHPMARAEFDQGSVSDSLPMEHMFLILRRSPEQQQALDKFSAELHDPTSANYHKWLTADQLGRIYGPSRQEINAVVQWLSSHGLRVNTVHKSGLVIDVSGNAAQVRDAFHTEIHAYNVHGKRHISNNGDVAIPSALAPVVVGISSLNDFMPKPLLKKHSANFTFPCTGCPDGFNNTPQFDVAPADLAKIYNVSPLYGGAHPITGKGQTIAVLEISDIKPSDVATFRKAFGLSSFSGTFGEGHPGPGCTDPGQNGEEGEAAIDAEWAGAVAPDARVNLESCANTSTNFGAFIAAQNLLEQKTPPPIMSLSFGGCEAAQGPAGNQFINAMWQQADAEGVSVFVSTGDGATAGCDDFNTSSFAIGGIAVNGLASTPYNFAAGGTDFSDTFSNTNGKYWKASNSANGESAKSYVPEMTWNDSCAGSVLFSFFGFSDGVTFCNSSTGMNFLDIVGASGGPSFVYSKPSWQKNVFGVPPNGKRNLPDVSLFASNGFWNHAILFCMSHLAEGGAPCNYSVPVDAFFNSAGGTSFTAPQFASIQALINQKAGRQGNPAPGYYALASAQYGTPTKPDQFGLTSCSANKGNTVGTTCYYHDVTRGNIDVPCFGTNNCFLPNGDSYGVLSTSNKSEQVAYPAQGGWDFATGLGTPNVTNVVNHWPK
jgi:subtilase family serine protease